VTFSVSAGGAGTLTYQWRKNQSAIAGATAASYTTPPLAITDDFSSFTVAVTNSGGTTISATANVSVGSAPISAASTPYLTEEGAAISLYAWPGKYVAVLTEEADLDPVIMRKMLDAIDAAYSYYAKVNGKTPPIDKSYNGLDTVAEVAQLCGGGCSYIGFSGIELSEQAFPELYNGIAQSNQYEQTVFYELGRNFYFYTNQLTYLPPDDGDCVTTGYAVAMRYLSLGAINLQGSIVGSPNGSDYDTIYTETQAIVDTYTANPTLTWQNTLEIGKSPAFGCTDLFASFVLRLRRDYGGEAFIDQLWQQAGLRPAAATTQDAVDNFVLAASAAAGQDLTGLFINTWRWPVSASAVAAAAAQWP
jgi:hypothetical protein